MAWAGRREHGLQGRIGLPCWTQKAKGLFFVLVQTFRLTEELKAADQAYRLGVLSLEDCRYKLEDVANRGFAELERLETEKLDIAQRACSRYARAQDTLANKQMDLVKTCLKSVDAMRAELDLERFRGDIRHAWIGPDRVLYDKYGYGKLKDLTFGVDLDRHLQGKARLVPFLVEKCVKTLERRGGSDF